MNESKIVTSGIITPESLAKAAEKHKKDIMFLQHYGMTGDELLGKGLFNEKNESNN